MKRYRIQFFSEQLGTFIKLSTITLMPVGIKADGRPFKNVQMARPIYNVYLEYVV